MQQEKDEFFHKQDLDINQGITIFLHPIE